MKNLFYYPLVDVPCNDNYFIYTLDCKSRDYTIKVFYHAGQLLDARYAKISQLRKDYPNITFVRFIADFKSHKDIEIIRDENGISYKHLRGVK